MPDDNPFRNERLRREANPFTAERERRAAGPQSTAGQAALYSGLTGAANLALGAPRAIAQMGVGGTSALAGGLVGNLSGEPFDFMGRYQQAADAMSGIPAPTVQQLAAGVRSAPALMPGGETPQDAYARNRESIQRAEGIMREEHPTASAIGDVGGDILGLVAGRSPSASFIRKAEERLLPKTTLLFGSAASSTALAPGVRRAWDRAINSTLPRKLARGAGRSVESGLEAAILEITKGENPDPLEAAGFAAGGQAMGSMFLSGSQGILSGGPLKAGGKIALTAASIGALWQTLKSATPGGKDFTLESLETGFDKVTYGLMLGGLAAAAGAPRYRSSRLAEDFPKIVDALATLPRGATLSLLTEFSEAEPFEQAQFESVLAKVARNPNYRGKDAVERKIVSRLRGTSVSGVIQR